MSQIFSDDKMALLPRKDNNFQNSEECTSAPRWQNHSTRTSLFYVFQDKLEVHKSMYEVLDI